MNLNVFDTESFPQSQRGMDKTHPTISFNKQGCVLINYAAVKLLELNENDKVAISQDNGYPDDWYICKTKNGFVVRLSSDKKSMVFNHSELSRLIRTHFGCDINKTKKFHIAGKPTIDDKVKYYGILKINNTI